MRNLQPDRLINRALIEKIFLTSLLSITFAQILPDVRATNLAIAAGVAAIIVINTAVSQGLARRGTEWSSIVTRSFSSYPR